MKFCEAGKYNMEKELAKQLYGKKKKERRYLETTHPPNSPSEGSR